MDEQRAELERYLRDRIAAQPVPDGRPTPFVATLGVRDALSAAPRPPLGAGTVIPVYLAGRSVVFGPRSAAADPAPPCYHCVAVRWQKLRTKHERNVLERGGHTRQPARGPFLTPFALDAIWRVFSWLAGRPAGQPVTTSYGFPYVYELRLDTLQVRRFALVADPDCRVCARLPRDTREGAVLDLVPRPKPDPAAYRLRSIHDYDIPFDAFANPVCGMLGEAMLPAVACGTTAPVTGYMYLRGSWHLHEFFWSGHADSYDDSARLAVFEGLERYSGLRRRRVDGLVVGSYRNLAPDALDPRECGVYPDEFYQVHHPYFTPFTPDLVMPWVWAYSLRDQRPLLVPERIVYYLSTDDRTNFVQECSNGCATGSCLEEAILYGMLELVERDAFLLAWYGRARLREIDLESLDNAEIRFQLDRISMLGYDVRLFDNRIDLPMPVVTGVATRRDGGLGALCLAAGAGMDPMGAVRAALCEIGSYVHDFEQRVLTKLDEVKPMAEDYSKVTELHHHPLVFGLPEMARHADFLLGPSRAEPFEVIYADWLANRPRTGDLLDDVKYCRDRLVEAGFDVIVAEQTSPEQERLGVRTVAVIVPGLIPIDFGWAKQRVLTMPRLRTAFRRAGWRDTDLADDEINRVPHPFP